MRDMRAMNESGMPGRTPAAGRVVLLVEDEQSLRMIIARNLEERGYRLTAVASVCEAIEQLQAAPPDVIVLDVNLPDGTGWEILRWLRSTDRHPAVIVYSAVPPSRKRVAEFQPDAVLLKPFPMDCLLDLVATVGSAARQGELVAERSV
jgi:DNA-binding response OmpR family regulator